MIRLRYFILSIFFISLIGCTQTSAPSTPGASSPAIATSPNHQTGTATVVDITKVTPTGEKPASTYTVTQPVAKSSGTATARLLTPTPKKPSPAAARTAHVSPTATSTPTRQPDDWQDLPVIPTISDRVVEIYRQGVAAGNNPTAFSKIGDCGSTPAWFLGDFDRGSTFYRLGDHADLELVINMFGGSFGRTSLAARSGFNASALFVPLWADRTYCSSSESPLACEYRIWRPSLAFIMLGTNDVWKPAEFEPQMRAIIEFSIQNGVVPILSTKADNAEGDGSINADIARLAQEYELPLWNFWAAVQDLPNGGLQEDQAHLTWGRNFFDDPLVMTNAWPVRNLTALQVLDAIWIKVSGAL